MSTAFIPANLTTATLTPHKIDELDALTITGDGYCAVVLLQGAQLIYFSTDPHHCTGSVDPINLSNLLNPINGVIHTKENTKENSKEHTESMPDNWLWVSPQAEYKSGVSVRGGIPICWPVFGLFEANPQAVKDSFQDCAYDITQHGYVDIQLFEIDSFTDSVAIDSVAINKEADVADTGAQLTLKLNHKAEANSPLVLKVKFIFSSQGLTLSLLTYNQSAKTVSFSQALHTYLPTDDISKTHISGFDGITYSDALTTDANTGGWQTKTQQGDIRFNTEVDRIYHGAPDITLYTPTHTYHLVAENSNSTVIWNPWIETVNNISQMKASDYQRMLCIETANAHLDYITLAIGDSHELVLEVTKIPF